MTQIYKVFKETKPLVLHNIPMHLSDQKNFIYIKIESPDDFETLLNSFWEFNGISGISLYAENLDAIAGKFRTYFKYVDAAGGIVRNSNGEILVIKRNGYLDLPKGHFKASETAQQAAKREVTEECGLKSLQITSDDAIQTYHMFELDNKKMLKATKWFKMISLKNEPLVPQKEEGIEEVLWMSEAEIKSKLPFFYPSLTDLLEGEFQ